MSSASASAAAPELRRLQQLYDRHRFLDVYQETLPMWQPGTDIAALSCEELVFAGRLAVRLGGWRLSRWLLRAAQARAPRHPQVRYFARNAHRRPLVDELREFEVEPDIGGDDPQLRASWFASFAYTWATLRDFTRAESCLARAHALFPGDAWVWCCESSVHGFAGRWPEALASAERAWQADPRAAFSADAVGQALLNLGRIGESAERLTAAAADTQSGQIVGQACWHQCALAEMLSGEAREAALAQAQALAERLPALAPLADREARAAFARPLLDIAHLAGDHQAMQRWAAAARSPFHREVLANLKKNPAGARIRLPFRHAIQKYDACVPTSLASAAAACGFHVSADEMAAEITFGGTLEWAAADWLRARGFHVRFFPVTAEVALALVRHGFAFVVSWDAEEDGHAVAVVGADEAAGTLHVHDPNAFRAADYLLTVFDRRSPLGIKGMAAVPPERAGELDALLPPDSPLMEAAQLHQKALHTEGLSAARAIVDEAARQFPGHPGTRYLQASQALDEGHTGEALRELRRLLQEYPDSPLVRVKVLFACRNLGSTAALRDTLADIVEKAVLPGVHVQQDWMYPPDRYVYEYADLLRLSASTRHRAGKLLRAVLRRDPGSAGAWHILADLIWGDQDREGSLLAYRLASCLAPRDEHYARAYAGALCSLGGEPEGFAWLETRARTFGAARVAAAPWISWIAMLEDWGQPAAAIAGCQEALRQHGGDPDLLSFAVAFFARMGDWPGAESALVALANTRNAAAFHQASLHFHRMRGEWAAALPHGEAWVREAPLSIMARDQLLDLVALRDGPSAALSLAFRWMRERPGHEDFEDVYCRQLDRGHHPSWKKYRVLRRRLARNAEDGWAWRELAFAYLYAYDLSSAARQRKLEPLVVEAIAGCDRTAPDDAATLRVHAMWLEYRGQWSEALEAWVTSAAAEPENSYSYRRAWECAARFDDVRRRETWSRLEPLLLNLPGHLTMARDLMALLAARFGPQDAEEHVERWRKARPEDPSVVEAAVDLLLDHGHGRTDAQRALALLQPAVAQFPYHLGLRFSLAGAHRALGQRPEAEAVLREIIHRHPDNSAARIQLARVMERDGATADAWSALEAAEAVSPRDPDVVEAQAYFRLRQGQVEEACALFDRALEDLPENVSCRSRAVSFYAECGAHEKAAAAARRGVEIYPDGAYMWLLLGRTLNEMRRFAAPGEIEACLRRSLELNPGLFESADCLSMLLVEQRRFDEAAQCMRDIEPRQADPFQPRGRLAWIRRAQGQKREAREELSRVVSDAPWYRWGWSLLLEWLVEDQAWDPAKDLLRIIPPPQQTHTPFRLQRLQVLERAGMPAADLDSEWVQLLRDFPEDLNLHLTRYDSLAAARRSAEATAVLDATRAFAPDNVYLLARYVEQLARAQSKSAAFDAALLVFSAPAEESTWPANTAWEAVANAGWSGELYDAVVRRLQQGGRVTRRTITLLAQHALDRTEHRQKQPWWRHSFPRRGVRQALELLEAVRSSPVQRGAGQAEIFSLLCDYGYAHLVVRQWANKMHHESLDADTWALVGRAFVAAERTAEGRRFLAAWRERAGVGQWLVANYALCLSRSRRRDLEELAASCRDALAGLPHDHTARYLAYSEAEARALLNDQAGLLQVWEAYAGYFESALQEHEFFPAEDRHLLHDLPRLCAFLREKKNVRAAWLRWKLRWFRASRPLAQTFSGEMQWWQWAIILLLILRFLYWTTR